ncbi:hypothetical protein KDL45_07925, partial [bacterium]|nr:hypothetical protein [bacterium]
MIRSRICNVFVHRAIGLAMALAMLAAVGCSSQVVKVPVNPYVDPDVNRRVMKRVAVLPFVVPEQLHFDQGGEAVSIQATNLFIAELAEEGLYDLVDPELVRAALKNHFPNPRDWIFQGSPREATRIAREVGADGVVFGVITNYIHGNLSDSRFEVEISAIEVAGVVTVWRVKEVLIGRGGKKLINETPESVPPSELAEVAAKDAADQVRRIHEAGGPINVVSMSYRQKWGYGLIAGGALSTAAALYYYNRSEEAYRRYKDSDNDKDIDRYRDQVEVNDQAWQVFGLLGLSGLGAGTYLVLTDQTMKTADIA